MENNNHSYDGPTIQEEAIGGKAQNLIALSNIEGIQVPVFTVISSECNDADIRKIVGNFLTENPDIAFVAVRSSADGEDNDKASFAGAYETFLNIEANEDAITKAVLDIREHAVSKKDTLDHYAKQRSVELSGNVGVVVQKMIDEPDFSGVMFSHDPQTKDGYMRIHFHRGIGETLVSGNANGKNLSILRGNSPQEQNLQDYPFLDAGLRAMKKIEEAMANESLDVEFAFKNNELYILQSRSLTAAKGKPFNQETLRRYASRIQRAIREILDAGDRLGDMIDINPRELLGDNPYPINVSLFRRMFADGVVERVREEMGYAPLHQGLARDVAGKPYVSLLTSAHSFRPQGVSDETYKKLTDQYVLLLDQKPELQDRVEFELFFMNASEENQNRLASLDFLTDDEKSEMLCALRKIDVSINKTAERELLHDKEETVSLAFLAHASLSETMDLLTESTQKFVTNARLAFYFKNLAENILGKNVTDALLKGMNTPSTDMQEDILAYKKGTCDKNALEQRYGHLRPGQLDIFSTTYRSNIDHILGLSRIDATYLEKQLQHAETQRIESEKTIEGLQTEEQRTVARRMRTFMERRERIKFDFMRIYDVLASKISEKAKSIGIENSELEQSTFDELLELNDEKEGGTMGKNMIRIQLKRRARHADMRKLVQLPSVLIPRTADLSVIEQFSQQATYVTDEIVSTDIASVTKEDIADMERLAVRVKGKIVVIDAADPGYDFLFTMQPSALVTSVGGPASHMYIRSIELGLPAAIGVGKGTFDGLRSSSRATLDCGRKQIIMLS